MPSFELHSFIRSPAAPGWEVLRVYGLWRAGSAQRLPYVWLVVDDGQRVLRVMPAPAVTHPVASPAGGMWSADFPLPTDLLAGRRTAFALQCGDAATVDLPRPEPGPPEPAGANRAGESAVQAELERRAGEARRQREELEYAVRSAEARARASERALEASRAALTMAEEARLERERRDAVAAAEASANGGTQHDVPSEPSA